MEPLTESSKNLISTLRSLLGSLVRADGNSEPFLSKLQSILEFSMVNAIIEACNGVDGLALVSRSLGDINEDIPTDIETLLKSLAKHKSKTDGKEEADGKGEAEGEDKQNRITN